MLHTADSTLQPVRRTGQPGSITLTCARGGLPRSIQAGIPFRGNLRAAVRPNPVDVVETSSPCLGGALALRGVTSRSALC
jgi:hypothetical protein